MTLSFVVETLKPVKIDTKIVVFNTIFGVARSYKTQPLVIALELRWGNTLLIIIFRSQLLFDRTFAMVLDPGMLQPSAIKGEWLPLPECSGRSPWTWVFPGDSRDPPGFPSHRPLRPGAVCRRKLGNQPKYVLPARNRPTGFRKTI